MKGSVVLMEVSSVYKIRIEIPEKEDRKESAIQDVRTVTCLSVPFIIEEVFLRGYKLESFYSYIKKKN